MQRNAQDQAIRSEVLATLKANPAASLDTVLGNWRYHRHGIVQEDETVQLKTILEDERAMMIGRDLMDETRPWWRFW